MALVRFFAAAEEAAGIDQQTRPEATLAALRLALNAEHPALAPILPRCALLVDGVRADDDHELGESSTVDVLPPFAGG
ncbi:MoaD/ThiS family protein [Agromyces aerolatus]|uniref:MoaD/ThiS family protein n=1 Tax=Agromyces sp. LY-1074 TaxID=3074080 RepID=UPI00285FC90D|nr:MULTISPECIES: MoaD/ThiS family protein [unclassified Agromyces]MDR5698784.1 MoaD/ThiS family protein [Agromyces sp. LY-1074]MDR5705438.1 MoaD/ThiS family protein [Agromyces sp. LY-1358]